MMKFLYKIGYFSAFLFHGAVLASIGYGVATWEFWALTISMVVACFASINAWGNW